MGVAGLTQGPASLPLSPCKESTSYLNVQSPQEQGRWVVCACWRSPCSPEAHVERARAGHADTRGAVCKTQALVSRASPQSPRPGRARHSRVSDRRAPCRLCSSTTRPQGQSPRQGWAPRWACRRRLPRIALTLVPETRLVLERRAHCPPESADLYSQARGKPVPPACPCLPDPSLRLQWSAG